MIILGYLIYGLILFPLSLIPLPILYMFSDLMRLILFDLIGYRKKVIQTNLRNSFPEKSEAELLSIQRKFERNFCDVFFAETIKGLSPFTGYLKRMLSFSNIEVMEEMYKNNKGVIIISGHFGNWEHQAHLSLHPRFKHTVVGIYKVQSKIADLIMKIVRGKSGAELIPMEDVKKSFEESKEKLNAYLFIGDQSPGNPRSAYWTTFLNQETGVLYGAEKSARVYDYAVVFLEVHRLKRGKYDIRYTLVSEESKKTKVGEITQKHTRLLEEAIQRQPESWLWSHRRWKHSNPNKK